MLAAPHAAGMLAVALTGVGYADPTPIDGALTLGVDTRLGFGPGDFPLAYAFGVDYQLGATTPGGFAYAFTLWPAGVGVVLGESAFFGILGGAGFSGVTTRVPASAELEAEARLVCDLPGPFALSAAARVAWLGAEARREGSPSFGFADEARGFVGLRVGPESDDFGINSGRGPLLAFDVREAFGTHGYGLLVAYQIDGFYDP
jgi:hypothetical protein